MKSFPRAASRPAKRNVRPATGEHSFRRIWSVSALFIGTVFATAAGAGAGTSDNIKADTREAVAMTKQVAADSWITTKVKSEILADSVSKGFEVNVSTTDGLVVLTGVLGNPAAIVRVREIAARVDGVKAVDTSALRVQASK